MQSEPITTLTNVDLWDGISARGSSTLRWRLTGTDAIIESVEPAQSVVSAASVDSAAPSASVGTVDAPGTAATPGYSVIPGLIDTHVHLVGFAGSGPKPDFLTWPLVTRPEEQALHGLSNARKGLLGGVTTMRDLSADEIQFSLRRAIDAGIVDGPRLQAHGMVSMTAGHGDMFIPAAFEHRKPTADGVDECRKLVRHWARGGADGVKIATSGGVLSEGDKASWRNHTPEEIAAIVDEAHALGMRVAAHAHTAAGIDVALEAGVDSIEHATLITTAQAQAAAAAGITLAPTILINDAIAAGLAGVSVEQSDKAKELVVKRDALMRAAADAGADFVLGTDANGHHVAFGDQMAEIRRMAEVFGWSAERTLQSATSRAAAAIGREKNLGTLSPGYLADFLVVRGRPWQNIADLTLENIVAVVSRGRVVAGALPQ